MNWRDILGFWSLGIFVLLVIIFLVILSIAYPMFGVVEIILFLGAMLGRVIYAFLS